MNILRRIKFPGWALGLTGGLIVGGALVAWAAQTNYLGTVFIADPTTLTQQMKVNADGSINVDAGASGAGITPVVSASAKSSHVLKNAPGSLYGVYVSATSAALYLMVFNATSVPGDGAVTPLECIQVPANTNGYIDFGGGAPEAYSTGISAAVSSTGCFSKTTAPTAFFHGRVQ